MSEALLALVFKIFSILMFAAASIYLYRLHLLLKKLKEFEGEEWKRLGSPTLIMNHSLRNSCLIVKWLLLEEYVNLADQKVVKEARLCRILLIVGLAAFIPYGIITFGLSLG